MTRARVGAPPDQEEERIVSLRSKIVYILLAVVLGYTAFDNGLQRIVSSRVYQSWEQEEGEKRAAEVAARIENHVTELEGKARIWAALPAVRGFLNGAPLSVEDVLGSETLASTGVDLFYLCDGEGRVVWSQVVDPSTGESIQLGRDLPAEALSRTHVLLTYREGQSAVSGLMMTQRWPLLVCAIPVPDSSGRALQGDGTFLHPVNGSVILGTFVGEGLRASIESAEDAAIEIFSPDETELTQAEREAVDRMTGGEIEVASLVGQDDKLHLFRTFQDLRTSYPLVLRVALERKITARGERAVRIALFSTIATALLILFVLLRLLQRIVIRPLSTLTTKAVEIGKTDDTTIRTGLERADEIGQLSSEFDSMLEKLAQSRAQVVSTARKAGMSDIATGVLHNVGNVLNSVNVSASLATKEVERLPTRDLEKMIAVLREHERDLGAFVTEDARGKHLLQFLHEVTSNLGTQRQRVLEELASLGTGIDHIADLVRSQQSYAGTKGVFESAALSQEIESALRIATQVLDWPSEIEVEREFAELPSVKVDKHKLMEILVNLIQNAGQAIKEAGGSRLTLRLMAGDGQARIEVADDGVGIPAENLARVFGHGFTTKGGGHGFGLHISANAATEMGGALSVRSDGAGQGATFVIDIPMSTMEMAPAA